MKSVFLLVVMIGMSNPTKISNDTHYNNISECIHIAKEISKQSTYSSAPIEFRTWAYCVPINIQNE